MSCGAPSIDVPILGCCGDSAASVRRKIFLLWSIPDLLLSIIVQIDAAGRFVKLFGTAFQIDFSFAAANAGISGRATWDYAIDASGNVISDATSFSPPEGFGIGSFGRNLEIFRSYENSQNLPSDFSLDKDAGLYVAHYFGDGGTSSTLTIGVSGSPSFDMQEGIDFINQYDISQLPPDELRVFGKLSANPPFIIGLQNVADPLIDPWKPIEPEFIGTSGWNSLGGATYTNPGWSKYLLGPQPIFSDGRQNRNCGRTSFITPRLCYRTTGDFQIAHAFHPFAEVKGLSHDFLAPKWPLGSGVPQNQIIGTSHLIDGFWSFCNNPLP